MRRSILPPGPSPTLSIDSVDRTATLRLAPEAAWAADYYSARERTEHPDGSVDAVFAVASESWLARLLVQLGPQAEIIDLHEGHRPGSAGGHRGADAGAVPAGDRANCIPAE